MRLLKCYPMNKTADESAENGDRVHRTAVLQALLVTFLWSTSWVLIKIDPEDIPALTFAGLRYVLAFLCLLLLALSSGHLPALRRIPAIWWGWLFTLGVLFYTITQGAQFLGLAYLPTVKVNLLLNLTTLLVAFFGMIFLAKRPTMLQWVGVFLFLTGIFIYFYPVSLPAGEVFGIFIALMGVIANALPRYWDATSTDQKYCTPW